MPNGGGLQGKRNKPQKAPLGRNWNGSSLITDFNDRSKWKLNDMVQSVDPSSRSQKYADGPALWTSRTTPRRRPRHLVARNFAGFSTFWTSSTHAARRERSMHASTNAHAFVPCPMLAHGPCRAVAVDAETGTGTDHIHLQGAETCCAQAYRHRRTTTHDFSLLSVNTGNRCTSSLSLTR